MPGRVSANTLTIPLTGPVLYNENLLLSVELEIEVAGRKFSYSYPPQPDLFHTFTWDGLDAYGRKVQGAQPITIRLGYKYVARRCDGLIATIAILFQICTTSCGARWLAGSGTWDSRGQGLGAWTLNIHHSYDSFVQNASPGEWPEPKYRKYEPGHHHCGRQRNIWF